MNTIVLFERKLADEVLIDEACAILNDGGVIVVPTDTIPGIGCRADNIEGIGRLFELKNRPVNLPVPIILGETDQINALVVDIPPVFYKLADRYWPGPLTMVLKSSGVLDSRIGGGGDTLGFRIPDHDIVRGIVNKTGCPLALTSANPHNTQPAGLHSQLLHWWNHRVEMIILGRSTVPRSVSSVINLTVDPPGLLRESMILASELSEIINING